MKKLIKKGLIFLLTISIFGLFIYKDIVQIAAYNREIDYYMDNSIELTPYYNDVVVINKKEVFNISIDSSNYFYFTDVRKNIIAENAYIELFRIEQTNSNKKMIKEVTGNSKISYEFNKNTDYLIFVYVDDILNVNIKIEDSEINNLMIGTNLISFNPSETKVFSIDVDKDDFYIITKDSENIKINSKQDYEKVHYLDGYQNYVYLYKDEENELIITNENEYELNLKIIITIVQNIDLDELKTLEKATVLKFSNKYEYVNVFDIISENQTTIIQSNNGVMHETSNKKITLSPDSFVYIIVKDIDFKKSELIVKNSDRQLFFTIDNNIITENFTGLEIGEEYKLDVVESVNNELKHCNDEFSILDFDDFYNYCTYTNGIYKINDHYISSGNPMSLGKIQKLYFKSKLTNEIIFVEIYFFPAKEEITVQCKNDDEVIVNINSTFGRGFDIKLEISNDLYFIEKIISIKHRTLLDSELQNEIVSVNLTKYLIDNFGYTSIKMKSIEFVDSPLRVNEYPYLNLDTTNYINFDDIEINNLFYGGSGTIQDPYQITCERHFENIRLTAKQVRYEEDQDSKMIVDNFVLLNDIELTKGFEPLPALKGSLKGANNEMKRIRVVWLCTGSKYNGSGLFETIWDGEVSDICIDIVYEINKEGSFGVRKGAICGYLIDGKIINCSSKGYFDNLKNNTSYSVIGGLVGEALRGEIINCNSEMVISSHGTVGQIVGDKTDSVIVS